MGTKLPVRLLQQNSSSLMRCTPSIECEPQYKHLAAGVVAVYAVDPDSHTVSLCSGVCIPVCVCPPWQATELSQVITELEATQDYVALAASQQRAHVDVQWQLLQMRKLRCL